MRAVDLDFPASIARECPAAFAVAWPVVEDIVSVSAGADFSRLERRSPALRGYDWTNYLTCSVIRMVRVLEEIRARKGATGRVLDVGSYFGNFALMCRRAGYDVDAVDAYREYGESLAACRRLLEEGGVRVSDFADVGVDLAGLGADAYDAIICAGVIEHVPHTPRLLLEALNRTLRPGGVLLLETPNLAYLYSRQKLARGDSVFCPIESQYYTELPFEGHHREYTVGEVEWMTRALGHEPVAVHTFNYSLYGAGTLSGLDADNFEAMQQDPSARELILSVSRKPGSGGEPSRPPKNGQR